MRTFKDQLLGSTVEDSQGECLPVQLLHEFVDVYRGKRQPLNQAHDLGKPSAGYIENIRVVPHPSAKGEYALIGDVYCDESQLEETVRGFSISFLEMLHRTDDHDIIVYLPYPHYNDTTFVRELTKRSQPVSVGKFVKKAADPGTTALIGAAVILFLTPIWDDIYKTDIAPKIRRFFRKNWQAFKDRRISADIVQTVDIDGHQVQVLLIPDRGKEKLCFSIESLDQAMQVAHQFLQQQPNSKDIVRLHLYFHSEGEGYKLHRVEDVHGKVEHHA